MRPRAGALAELRSVVCTRRFLRFCAFSAAMLPALSVLRNLDGGIFPKFMVRSFGPRVPKGSIYSLNPFLDLLLVPALLRRSAHSTHFVTIRAGLTLAAVSPAAVALGGATLPTVILFVLILTVGDATYNPRVDAYAMRVAPEGREGAFAGASAALVFLAEARACSKS